MDRGIYVAASGAVKNALRLDTIANNLAAVSVPGFKKDLTVFNSIDAPLDVRLAAAGPPEKTFVSIADVFTDFSGGIIKETGNTLDMAISGEGFFVIETPEGPRYTRKGDFTMNMDGTLTTNDGYVVQGEAGAINLTGGDAVIERNGDVEINGQVVDRIKVVVFDETLGLEKQGGVLFNAPDGIKSKPLETPVIAQGYLESSNVNAVKEMVMMINTMRAYEAQIKLIQSFDKVSENAVSLATRG
ncbi:MAG: flagellar hook-basal body protein [Deltaproteobacteria bacterium]|nr:flagellar hook-basal body protein [Deltaproteobacteria bacterium]